MSNITKIEIDKHLEDTFMPYAMTTILDRALPKVYDGLKPIHLKILYAMHNKGLLVNKDRAKSTEAISETMKIHHHGDSSIYEAIALMTEQNETLLHPFIDGEGAFGKVYSKDNPSAARYTFCRLNKFAEEFFHGINNGVVDFLEEGGHKQPMVLPVNFPNILIKPNSGIAVGEACNFPSFNLREVCEYTKAYLQNENSDVMEYIQAPDFSTGGDYILDKKELEKVLSTGRGAFKLRARYTYNQNENCIEINEIPYSTTADAIIDKVTQIIKSNRNKDILDVRDETGYNTETQTEELKITIDVRKKIDIDKTMAYLYKSTPLESSFNANMNCIVENSPKVLGVKDIIKHWSDFRMDCIRKELAYDLNKNKDELELLNGLSAIVCNLDRAITIIKDSSDDKEVLDTLTRDFGLNERQASYVADIKLRSLNKDWISKKINRIAELEATIGKLEKAINSDKAVKAIICKQLDRIVKDYAKPRKTTIISPGEVVEVKEEMFIEDYNCYVSITKEGYIKKMLRPSDNIKVKDGDQIITYEQTSNKATVLVFTDKGNCYKVFIHDVETSAPSTLGQYLPTLIKLEDGEQILNCIIIRKYNGDIINIYADGKAARVKLDTFKTEQKRLKLKNSLSSSAPLVAQYSLQDGEVDLLCKSSLGKVLIVNTAQFNAKESKSSAGDKLINLKEGTLESCVDLKQLDLSLIDSVDYYKGKRGSVGNKLKPTDSVKRVPIN